MRTVGRSSMVRNWSFGMVFSVVDRRVSAGVVVGHSVEMFAELIQPCFPHPSVRRQPVVELGERLDTQPVPAPGTVDAHGDHPGVAQHTEVFGGRRLGECERFSELAGQALTASEFVEDRPSDRLSQGIERRQHSLSMPAEAYAAQGIKAMYSQVS